MTDPHAAARRLADVLDRENDALRAMDLRRAAAFLPEKSAAIAALATSAEAGVVPVTPGLVSVTTRLSSLVSENRVLLERAIAAQQRVIGIVVRAAAAASTGPGYGARGPRALRPSPIAFATRA